MRSLYSGSIIALFALSVHARSAAAMADHDSTLIVAAVERFHTALAAADSASVRSILSDDVVVLESGFLETRSEYLSHHLAGDIDFARALPSPRKVIRINRAGDMAWVVSTSTTSGNFKGRAINSQGAELMVLVRVNGEWKIQAIHWSSARRQT